MDTDISKRTPEFTTFWDYPNDRFLTERDRPELTGSYIKGGRDKPKFRPFDLLTGATYTEDGLTSIPVYDGEDMTVFVECPAGACPFFHREANQDVVYLQYAGTSTIQSEFGTVEMEPGDVAIVPRGLSQRTIGSSDSLRWAMYYTDPVRANIDVENPTLNYHIEVRREPQISYQVPSLDSNNGVTDGKVREVIRFRGRPEDDTWFWRSYDELTTSGRKPGRGIVKFGFFNYLKGITGGHGGPPCTPVVGVTGKTRLEAFNTVGEMTSGFHRGSDSEEMWCQFGGAAQNESEFGKYILGTSEMAYVPMGIAHHVVGLDGYLRCTLYARNYMRQLVTDADHLSESRFTVAARTLEPQLVG